MMKREILMQQVDRPVPHYKYDGRLIPDYDPRECSRILLIPDSPPVALHGDDCAYVQKSDFMESDAQLVAAVERAFGPESVEFISEDTAATVIHALTHEATYISQ